jgi:hypothetical protein
MGVRPGRPARQPVTTIRVSTTGGHQFSGETEDNWRTIRHRDISPEERNIWLKIKDGNYEHAIRFSEIVAVTEW